MRRLLFVFNLCHQQVVVESRTNKSEQPCELARRDDEAMAQQHTRLSPNRSQTGKRVIALLPVHLRAVDKYSKLGVTIRDHPRNYQRPG